MIEIEILNPIFSICHQGEDLIKPILLYKDMTVRKVWETDDKGNRFQRKKKLYYDKSLLSKSGIFYTGFIPRIQDYCKKKGFKLNLTKSEEHKLIDSISPGSYELDGITLRPDQKDTVKQVLEARRGCLIAVMSYGKSIIAASILKAFEGQNCLVMSTKKSVLTQLKDDFKKYGLKSVGMLDKSDPKKHKITISTLQSLVGIDLSELFDHFYVTIWDEIHVGCGFGSMGERVLSACMSPIRIGLTATLPQEEKQRIAMEGMVGPVIKKVDFEEGNQLGILTKAKLKLIPVPKCKALDGVYKYQDIYKVGIVDYRIRNQMIVQEAKKLNDIGKSCLIFVVNLDHGQNIYDLACVYGLNPVYVKGNTTDEDRDIVKKGLHEKDYMCVISTNIFREGINIKSLDCILMGFGGKSSTALSQALGRGLRQWEGKDNCLIVDFLDHGKYLSEHCIERIELYKELKLIDLG